LAVAIISFSILCDSFFPCSEQLYKSEADEEAFRNPHRWYGDAFRNPHRWYGDAAELICGFIGARKK
jgi:hypothetical protein